MYNWEKYVIAVRDNHFCWRYLGYKEDEYGYQKPAFVDERDAMEFATMEQAKAWCNGAKKYIQDDINTYCDPMTLCIKQRAIRYEYRTIAFA